MERFFPRLELQRARGGVLSLKYIQSRVVVVRAFVFVGGVDGLAFIGIESDAVPWSVVRHLFRYFWFLVCCTYIVLDFF
jgi:hypothetical protein